MLAMCGMLRSGLWFRKLLVHCWFVAIGLRSSTCLLCSGLCQGWSVECLGRCQSVLRVADGLLELLIFAILFEYTCPFFQDGKSIACSLAFIFVVTGWGAMLTCL